jgi:hypothetical protein
MLARRGTSHHTKTSPLQQTIVCYLQCISQDQTFALTLTPSLLQIPNPKRLGELGRGTREERNMKVIEMDIM